MESLHFQAARSGINQANTQDLHCGKKMNQAMSRAESPTRCPNSVQKTLCHSEMKALRCTEASLEEKFAAKTAAWKRRPEVLNTTHEYFEDDSRLMRELDPEKKVHLIVTSPPYWNLKRYTHEGHGVQLGHQRPRRIFTRARKSLGELLSAPRPGRKDVCRRRRRMPFT